MEQRTAEYLDAANGHIEVSTLLITDEIQEQQLKTWAKKAAIPTDGSFLLAVEEGTHAVAKLANDRERYEKAVADAADALKTDPSSTVYIEPRLFAKIEAIISGNGPAENQRIKELEEKLESMTTSMGKQQDELIAKLNKMKEDERENLTDALRKAKNKKTDELEKLKKEMADMARKMKNAEGSFRTNKNDETNQNEETDDEDEDNSSTDQEEYNRQGEDATKQKKKKGQRTSGN